MGRTMLEVALEHTSCTASISTHTAKDGQHTATRLCKVTGHILNAAFFSSDLLVVPHDLSSQCNQHNHPQCWKSVCSLKLSPVSLHILLLKKCYKFLRDDVLTSEKFTLSVAFAAYLCNHLFMLL